jgi:hypothetical protein
MAEKTIFFLTGLPKSGTTWLMRMLDFQTGVVCRGEGRFFSSNLIDVPSLWGALHAGLEPWYSYVAHRKRNWIGLDHAIQTKDRANLLNPDTVRRNLEQDLTELFRFAVRHFMLKPVEGRRSETAQFIGDKTPVVESRQLDQIFSTFPDSRVLFLRRGVKDFIVSLAFHYWRSQSTYRPDRQMELLEKGDFQQIERWRQNPEVVPEGPVLEATAVRLAKVWTSVNQRALQKQEDSPGLLMVLDYESLFENPADHVTRALAFLGIPADETVIKNAIDSTGRSAVQESSDGALRAHLRSGQPGDWRCYLGERVSAAIDACIAAEEFAQNPESEHNP